MEAWCPQRGRRGAAPNPESLALGQMPDNCFRVFDLPPFGSNVPCKSCSAPRGTLFRLATRAFFIFPRGAKKWVTWSVSGHGNRLASEFWSLRKPSISPGPRYFNWRYTMSVTGILSSSMFSNQVDPNRTSCARSHTHHRASDFETLEQAFAPSSDTPTLTMASAGQNADTATFSPGGLTSAQQAPVSVP